MGKRNLFLDNTPVEEALERYMEALRRLEQDCSETEGRTRRRTELVRTEEALGRVTAEAVTARLNSPLYDSAAMDGIAVISEKTRGAADHCPVTLFLGEDYLPVDTGDPIRPPFDAVIMAEDVWEAGGAAVQIREAASPWQHVRPIGEDIVQGEMILPGNHPIRPMDIGVLLSGGINRVAVKKKPSVAIFPTGTEIIEPDEEMREGAIIESNSRMFEAMIREGGGEAFRFPVIPDDYEQIKEAVCDAAAKYDMVIVIAGSSAGTEDYTVHVLRELGEIIVHGVSMKPGKPVILSLVKNRPVIGLPGYPVSAWLAYENFAAPVLEMLGGVPAATKETVQAVLTKRLVSSLKYKEYVRVKLGLVGRQYVASPLARGAGAAMSLVRADGFCIIDQNCEGVEAGSNVEVRLSCRVSDLERTVVSIGSHDLILDVLADKMTEKYKGCSLSSTHVGSMGGLMALKRGEAHMAPVHILDEVTGQYNVPILSKMFPDRPIALVKGVGRVQGLMVQRGNPLRISGIEDLPGCRYVNRQRGAGTRILFDFLLRGKGMESSCIEGYGREAATHMAVAAAVAGGSADVGLGILSAARAMDLDFLPIQDEEYDFAIPCEYLELSHIQAFIHLLRDKDFHSKLEELGGYTYDRCGEVLYLGRY